MSVQRLIDLQKSKMSMTHYCQPAVIATANGHKGEVRTSCEGGRGAGFNGRTNAGDIRFLFHLGEDDLRRSVQPRLQKIIKVSVTYKLFTKSAQS